jgi:hypothetical protein
MVRLRALVSRERRIEMLPLRLANRPRNIAIAGVWNALQGGGQVEQKGVTACHSQRPRRIEDGIELAVAQSDRRRHAWPRSGIPAYA